MAAKQLFAQRGDALIGSLDDQQLLAVDGYLSFPVIHGFDARHDVDAGREAKVDQCVSERACVEVGADRGQHDHRLHRSAIVAVIREAASRAAARATLRYCAHWAIGTASESHERRPPIANAVGSTALLRLRRSSDAISS